MSRWHLVKLELAPTSEFPKGSPGRAFLLRLPVTVDGAIDGAKLADAPRSAFVRRYWANEPDRSGFVLPNSTGWTFAFSGERGDSNYHLDDGRLIPGGLLEATGPGGIRLPFRICSVIPD